MEPSVKIFSGNATPDLARNISEYYGTPAGQVTIQKFSDGEFQPIFQESIRGDYVFLVQSTYSPRDHLMEL
jgi:ribose-phosphate pyrophosphokinase